MDNSRKVSFSDDNDADFLLSAGKNHLFVIGIDKYENGIRPLDNCVRDAEKLVEILTSIYDFDKENASILYNENATNKNIIKALDKYAEQLTEGDNLIIYFSGHGYFKNNIGYLVPADAENQGTWSLIPNSSIKDYIRSCKAKHILFIVDSCYSGSFLLKDKDFAEQNSFPEKVIKLPSRWVLAAGRIEKVSDGEYGKHSPFAQTIHAFLETNTDHIFAVSELAQYVKTITTHNAEQLPIAGILQGSNDFGGEFVFIPRNNEKEDFAACKTKKEYELFAKKYPNSRFLSQINEKIILFLQEEAKDLYNRIVTADWDKKRALIESYLSQYEKVDKILYIKVLEEDTKIDDYNIWKDIPHSPSGLRLFIAKYPQNFFVPEAQKILAEKLKEGAEQKEKERLAQEMEAERLKKEKEQAEKQRLAQELAAKRAKDENERNEKERLSQERDAKRLKEQQIAAQKAENERIAQEKKQIAYGNTISWGQKYKFHVLGAVVILLLLVWLLPNLLKEKKVEPTQVNQDSINKVAEKRKQDSLAAPVVKVPQTDVAQIDTGQKLPVKQPISPSKTDTKTTPAVKTEIPPSKTSKYKEPELVSVQGGTFDMGDVFGEGEDDEKTVHSVTVGSFQMGKYEVSFAEYDLFCEAKGIRKPKDEGWGRGNRPVINVSWNDADAYCKWLSIQTGKKYRLPTEAEWEYAARERGQKVRFGNGENTANPAQINFDGSASYKKDYSVAGEYRGKTVPVNSLSANSLGLYNMSGNVWEWCSDWYDANFYKNSRKDNPNNTTIGSYRVLRGGSWNYYPRSVRCAYRFDLTPDYRNYGIGFRLVCLP